MSDIRSRTAGLRRFLSPGPTPSKGEMPGEDPLAPLPELYVPPRRRSILDDERCFAMWVDLKLWKVFRNRLFSSDSAECFDRI